MPVIALVAMYRKTPTRYIRWRNTLLFMLVFGLVGFWLYPLTPPRLMPPHYGFVDTASGSSTSGRSSRSSSTPTASRPRPRRRRSGTCTRRCPASTSGWSTWSALALLPLCGRVWLKVLVCLYPFCTSSRSWSPRITGSSTRSAAGWCWRSATGHRGSSRPSRPGGAGFGFRRVCQGIAKKPRTPCPDRTVRLTFRSDSSQGGHHGVKDSRSRCSSASSPSPGRWASASPTRTTSAATPPTAAPASSPGARSRTAWPTTRSSIPGCRARATSTTSSATRPRTRSRR